MGSARLLLFCTIDIKDTRRFHLSIIRPNSTVGQVPVVPELNTCPALFIYTSVSCNPQSDLPNSIESELKKKKKRKENDVHSPKCLDNSICSRYIYSERRSTTRTTSRACHVRPVRTEIVDVRGQAERDGDH